MCFASERSSLIGMFALCACTASPGQPMVPKTQLAKAEPVATETMSASEAIADARCAREVSCNNVGVDKRYVSLDDCLTRAWTAWEGDLVESECESGVDETKLEACLTDIRVLECSVALESLELLPACAASRICAE